MAALCKESHAERHDMACRLRKRHLAGIPATLPARQCCASKRAGCPPQRCGAAKEIRVPARHWFDLALHGFERVRMVQTMPAETAARKPAWIEGRSLTTGNPRHGDDATPAMVKACACARASASASQHASSASCSAGSERSRMPATDDIREQHMQRLSSAHSDGQHVTESGRVWRIGIVPCLRH